MALIDNDESELVAVQLHEPGGASFQALPCRNGPVRRRPILLPQKPVGANG